MELNFIKILTIFQISFHSLWNRKKDCPPKI